MLESPELRWDFIRKLYSIIAIQLLVTIVVASVVVSVRPISHLFSTTGAGLALYIVLIITSLIGQQLSNSTNPSSSSTHPTTGSRSRNQPASDQRPPARRSSHAAPATSRSSHASPSTGRNPQAVPASHQSQQPSVADISALRQSQQPLVMIEIPYIFVLSAVYGFIVYAMIGFEWTATKFFWYLFFMFFTLLYFTFYGMMTVPMTPNHHIAGIVSILFYGLWNVFSGFVIPRPRIPIWWRWYYWANPVAWTLYGLFVSQFGDIEDKMESGETVKEFLRSYFDFKYEFLGVVAVVVVGFAVLFGVLFAVGIKRFNFQNR